MQLIGVYSVIRKFFIGITVKSSTRGKYTTQNILIAILTNLLNFDQMIPLANETLIGLSPAQNFPRTSGKLEVEFESKLELGFNGEFLLLSDTRFATL